MGSKPKSDKETMSDLQPTAPESVVARLAGVLKGLEIKDQKEEYGEYLTKKYSRS
ncbi:MAG TPA: hypothetical protein VHU81_07245 [Thermoanaerobaculia bacterium]|jgi:hypothetical protein|nr:hypothetical protein [Thermoanaerobaculia bacterium]